MDAPPPAGGPTAPPPPASPVGSVDKALVLLEVLAAAGPEGITLRDVAGATGFNKASAHRLLRALMHRGFAEQSVADQSYRLGPSALELSGDFDGGEDLPALFAPALASVSQQTDELVHLGRMDGPRVLYLDKVEPERTLRVWSRVGRRAPAARTAMGRAMLAADGTRGDALLAYAHATGAAGTAPPGAGEGTGSVDPGVPISAERLCEVVAAAARRGWAAEVEENEAGIACVGVALVRPAGGSVAVSVTGPIERMGEERRSEVGELLRSTLERLAPPGFTLPPRG